jgi:hypothetical protein
MRRENSAISDQKSEVFRNGSEGAKISEFKSNISREQPAPCTQLQKNSPDLIIHFNLKSKDCCAIFRTIHPSRVSAIHGSLTKLSNSRLLRAGFLNVAR